MRRRIPNHYESGSSWNKPIRNYTLPTYLQKNYNFHTSYTVHVPKPKHTTAMLLRNGIFK